MLIQYSIRYLILIRLGFIVRREWRLRSAAVETTPFAMAIGPTNSIDAAMPMDTSVLSPI
jgi:hypothetical protein